MAKLKEEEIIKIKSQLQLQKINASLTMLTVGIIAFISTFIWYGERIIFGIALSLIIILISLIFYQKSKKELNKLIT